MAATGEEVVWITLRSKKPPHEWYVHPELRKTMIADANERGTNLTDLAKQILCEHFKVPYEPNLRRSKPREDSPVINFGAPPALIRALSLAFPGGGNKRMDGMRRILCIHYGLSMPPKVRHTRRRSPQAAKAA